ncbi:Ger(x)C family spore germination protein [Pelosinus sp. sgz500959]|uniref:Ger(x)C family spore germination protein n=1 Tax=Pelosinus sp. sgz500959 TaxID=3242472 RepID=UPI00366FF121
MCRQLSLLIALVSISIVLLGCSGAKELDERANVIAVGLDTGEQEDMVRVSYQFAVPQTESGKEAAEKSSFVITNSASSIAEALNLISSEIALQPSVAHVKVIVIGEEQARKGLGNILSPFMRYYEYRGSIFVLVARGTAKDFLEKNKPILVNSLSKYYELMLAGGENSGYFLGTSLHQFYMRLKSHSAQPYMALVGINPKSGEGEKSISKVPGGKIDGYKAGDIPRHGGNPAEFAGTALFFGDKMVGTLSTTETRMLAMLIGKYSHGFLSVEDPLDPKSFINISLQLGSKPKIKTAIVEGHPVIHVSILLEGNISSIGSGINYEQENYLKLLEGQINKVYQQEMINLIRRTQELDADVAGFGDYLRPVFQTNKELEDYQWNQKYRQAEVFVDINTKVRRNGLMLRTLPVE